MFSQRCSVVYHAIARLPTYAIGKVGMLHDSHAFEITNSYKYLPYLKYQIVIRSDVKLQKTTVIARIVRNDQAVTSIPVERPQ